MTQTAKAFLTTVESVRGPAALFHSFHLVPIDGVRVFDHRLWQLHGPTEIALRLIMVPFNGGAAVGEPVRVCTPPKEDIRADHLGNGAQKMLNRFQRRKTSSTEL